MSDHHDYRGRRGSVAVIARRGRLLVIRRCRSVVAPRTFCFPGGGIEPGETEQEALVREMREELGAAIHPLRRIWRSVTPWQVRLAWWSARLDDGAELVPNPAEVESVHWYTPAEMAQLSDLLESNRWFLEAVAAGEIELDLG